MSFPIRLRDLALTCSESLGELPRGVTADMVAMLYDLVVAVRGRDPTATPDQVAGLIPHVLAQRYNLWLCMVEHRVLYTTITYRVWARPPHFTMTEAADLRWARENVYGDDWVALAALVPGHSAWQVENYFLRRLSSAAQ